MLTAKQEAFVLALFETDNQSEAYRRAYDAERMAPGTLWKRASELSQHGEVKGRLAELREAAAAPLVLERTRWLRELAAVAYGNLDDVMPWDESGPRLTPSDQLPRHAKALIAGIKFKREREYRGNDDDQEEWIVDEVQIRLNSKQAALDSLGKAMGWNEEKGDAAEGGDRHLHLHGLTVEQLYQLARGESDSHP